MFWVFGRLSVILQRNQTTRYEESYHDGNAREHGAHGLQ